MSVISGLADNIGDLGGGGSPMTILGSQPFEFREAP